MNGDPHARDGRLGSSRSYSTRDETRERGDRGDRGDRGADRGGDRERRRRRSRSPRLTSRRDYEVDTYSSSRDYREREREDTYARRERRDDRAWGDTYSSRRDGPRRDDDRGHGRRDRDAFADRGVDGRQDRGDRERGDRGPPRRRGGDRDRDAGFGGGRERRKSPSPVFQKPREKTPDLSNVVSVLHRNRRLTQWDIKPAGYENITAEQAKLSGMFPLPGAPRQAAMDPAKLAAFISPSAGTATASALKPENANQAKRLFVYNIPQDATADSLTDFFNLQLNGLNVVSGPNPCISAQIAANGEYALLQFKTTGDATMALALDGIQAEDDNGGPDRPGLSIRRPKDYIVPVSSDGGDYVEGQISSDVKDSPNKLSISNIPFDVPDSGVKEILEAFGELKAFIVVRENMAELNRGIAFCEYVNSEAVDQVIESLNTIPLGNSGNLRVQRASVGVEQNTTLDGGVNAISMLAGSNTNDASAEGSRVLMLMNMVTHEDLINRETYEDIKEDIEDECAKYGKILECKIPRPSGARTNPGVGKVYIKYETLESARAALGAISGKTFDKRTVIVSHFSEEAFDVDAW